MDFSRGHDLRRHAVGHRISLGDVEPIRKVLSQHVRDLPQRRAAHATVAVPLIRTSDGRVGQVRLEEAEILSVLGHEFGHLKGRDPLILYGLVSAQYLFQFYVLFRYFPFIFSSFLLLIIYFWIVMVGIFFIAKFFEARADLVSAIMVGTPQVLAGSLEKIGFQRLLFERTPSYRIQEWIGLDPHPPIYFRVDRLEKLSSGKIKHPLLRSIRDVIKGFIATLKG